MNICGLTSMERITKTEGNVIIIVAKCPWCSVLSRPAILHHACFHGLHEFVRILLLCPKINVNTRNRHLETPLHMSIKTPHPKGILCMIELLKVSGHFFVIEDRTTNLFWSQVLRHERDPDRFKGQFALLLCLLQTKGGNACRFVGRVRERLQNLHGRKVGDASSCAPSNQNRFRGIIWTKSAE